MSEQSNPPNKKSNANAQGDLLSYAKTQDKAGHNNPEISVSELSQALKRTVEQRFSHVRVRGELSRVTVAKSGHLYTSLKDDNAVLDAICWKGSLARLSIKPEEGLEVVCTGRLTTYPGRSNYQLIIESMELAGEGALLKMLEERKKKLAAEGLFDPARKKALPYLPRTIGIVTSPTGAVIRDILHRIKERFPAHVYLWPVMVQGKGAEQQIANAIHGFNTLRPGFKKPDLLIVARGGGSLEDLMPFNEEIVVRAAAQSDIPVISAVGHETDVTLIDYAADKRAPTPTGAAEMSVPVRRDLVFTVNEHGQRLEQSLHNLMTRRRERLDECKNALSRFPRLLEQKNQRFDFAASALPTQFTSYLQSKTIALSKTAGRLQTPQSTVLKAQARLQRADINQHFGDALSRKTLNYTQISAGLKTPQALVDMKGKALQQAYESLARKKDHLLDSPRQRLESYHRILETLSFRNVLKRGYSVVRDQNNQLITSSENAKQAQNMRVEFADGQVDVQTKQTK